MTKTPTKSCDHDQACRFCNRADYEEPIQRSNINVHFTHNNLASEMMRSYLEEGRVSKEPEEAIEHTNSVLASTDTRPWVDQLNEELIAKLNSPVSDIDLNFDIDAEIQASIDALKEKIEDVSLFGYLYGDDSDPVQDLRDELKSLESKQAERDKLLKTRVSPYDEAQLIFSSPVGEDLYRTATINYDFEYANINYNYGTNQEGSLANIQPVDPQTKLNEISVEAGSDDTIKVKNYTPIDSGRDSADFSLGDDESFYNSTSSPGQDLLKTFVGKEAKSESFWMSPDGSIYMYVDTYLEWDGKYNHNEGSIYSFAEIGQRALNYIDGNLYPYIVQYNADHEFIKSLTGPYELTLSG